VREIYIVLTKTQTMLSRAIRLATKYKYNHTSLALDIGLEPMYSFGRLRPHNPFIGRFVEESIHRGFFKSFPMTCCLVLELSVDDETYVKLQTLIIGFKSKQKDYKYNIRGLFLAGVKIDMKYRKNKFYCTQFVKHVLNEAGVDISILPECVTPNDFNQIEGVKTVYEGLLKEYSIK